MLSPNVAKRISQHCAMVMRRGPNCPELWPMVELIHTAWSTCFLHHQAHTCLYTNGLNIALSSFGASGLELHLCWNSLRFVMTVNEGRLRDTWWRSRLRRQNISSDQIAKTLSRAMDVKRLCAYLQRTISGNCNP